MTAEDDPHFAEFWRLYPRKDAKGAARKAWKSALKRGATPAAIIAGVRAYPFSPDPKFQPMPTTWLNQDRFEGVVITAPLTIAASAQSRSSWRDKYEHAEVPYRSFPEQRAIRADEPFTIEGSLFDD